MIQFEIAFLVMLSIVAVVTIAAVGRPLAEAHAEKLKSRYREMPSEKEEDLRRRLSLLEKEVIDLKDGVLQAQASADFAVKILEEHRRSPAAKIDSISLSDQNRAI